MFFYRAGRDFQFFGDLGNAFVVETIHDKNFPALGWKLVDRFFNMFLKF